MSQPPELDLHSICRILHAISPTTCQRSIAAFLLTCHSGLPERLDDFNPLLVIHGDLDWIADMYFAQVLKTTGWERELEATNRPQGSVKIFILRNKK